MTPFSDWVRALPAPLDSKSVSVQNLDYIWFHYKAGWFIAIEEKRFGGESQYAQRQTHSVVSQMLTLASPAQVNISKFERKRIEYRGYYLIVFEKTTPDDSAWVKINGQVATRIDLLHLLLDGAI